MHEYEFEFYARIAYLPTDSRYIYKYVNTYYVFALTFKIMKRDKQMSQVINLSISSDKANKYGNILQVLHKIQPL